MSFTESAMDVLNNKEGLHTSDNLKDFFKKNTDLSEKAKQNIEDNASELSNIANKFGIKLEDLLSILISALDDEFFSSPENIEDLNSFLDKLNSFGVGFNKQELNDIFSFISNISDLQRGKERLDLIKKYFPGQERSAILEVFNYDIGIENENFEKIYQLSSGDIRSIKLFEKLFMDIDGGSNFDIMKEHINLSQKINEKTFDVLDNFFFDDQSWQVIKQSNQKLTIDELVFSVLYMQGKLALLKDNYGNDFQSLENSVLDKLGGGLKQKYIESQFNEIVQVLGNERIRSFFSENKGILLKLANLTGSESLWLIAQNLSKEDNNKSVSSLGALKQLDYQKIQADDDFIKAMVLKVSDNQVSEVVNLLNKLGADVNKNDALKIKQNEQKNMALLFLNASPDLAKLKAEFEEYLPNISKKYFNDIKTLFSQKTYEEMKKEAYNWNGDVVSFLKYFIFEKKHLFNGIDDFNEVKIIFSYTKVLEAGLKSEKLQKIDENKEISQQAKKIVDSIKEKTNSYVLKEQIEKNGKFFEYLVEWGIYEAVKEKRNRTNEGKISISTKDVADTLQKHFVDKQEKSGEKENRDSGNGLFKVANNYNKNKNHNPNKVSAGISGDNHKRGVSLFTDYLYGISTPISVDKVGKNISKLDNKISEAKNYSQISFSNFAHNLEAVEAEKDLLKSSSEGYAKQEVEKLTLKEGEIKHQEIDGLHIFEYRIGPKQYRLLSLTMFKGNQVILEDFVKDKTGLKIDFVGRPDDFKMFSDDLTKDIISANEVNDTLKFTKNYIFEKFFANPGEKEKEFVKKYNLNPEDLYKKEEEFYKKFSNAIKAETNIGGFEFDFGRLKLDLSTLSEDYFDKTKWSENEEKVKEGKFKLSANAKKEDTIWSKIGHILSSIARS